MAIDERRLLPRPAVLPPLASMAPLLPAIAAFYLVATIHSAISYWRGAGGMWKGRVQDGA